MAAPVAGTLNPAGLSEIVAGAWRLAEWDWTPQQRLAWIEGLLDLGISSFDHADAEGEPPVAALFGQALALRPALRAQLQLVVQCGLPPLDMAGLAGRRARHAHTAAARLRDSVQAQLRALRTDHLDLLLLHRPDPLLDFDELAETFAALRRDGLVRHFGLSDARPPQLAPLHRRFALATHQLELSPLHTAPLHDGTLDQCQDLGLRPMAWAPLAGGRLLAADTPAARRVRQTLGPMAEALGVSPTTLAIAWVRRHPSRPLPVLGTRRLAVAREARAALDLVLDAEPWRALWAAAEAASA